MYMSGGKCVCVCLCACKRGSITELGSFTEVIFLHLFLLLNWVTLYESKGKNVLLLSFFGYQTTDLDLLFFL